MRCLVPLAQLTYPDFFSAVQEIKRVLAHHLLALSLIWKWGSHWEGTRQAQDVIQRGENCMKPCILITAYSLVWQLLLTKDFLPVSGLNS